MSKHAADATFMTPRRFADEQHLRIESPRGSLLIASCRSGYELASRAVHRYDELLDADGDNGACPVLHNLDSQFSDSETRVRLDLDVNGRDVFLFQLLCDPTSDRSVDENYMAFLIAVRALREWGAAHVTGVVPYLAYSRQDKPTTNLREPTTARLMADLAEEAGLDRLVTWHAHSPQIRGFYEHMPMDILDPMPVFVEAFQGYRQRDDVIVVAPDLGASKFIEAFSQRLGLRSAIAFKHRPRLEEAEVTDIVGDFAGRKIALVLDDIIGTAGTIHALTRKLVEAKDVREIHLGVSHNLCMSIAKARLVELYEHYRLKRLVVTNSVPQTDEFRALPFVTVHCLGDVLCHAINQIHYNRPVGISA
jgi:ribose-phosphate pyrophosphokinase